jgi:hypothetical protein
MVYVETREYLFYNEILSIYGQAMMETGWRQVHQLWFALHQPPISSAAMVYVRFQPSKFLLQSLVYIKGKYGVWGEKLHEFLYEEEKSADVPVYLRHKINRQQILKVNTNFIPIFKIQVLVF